ncbi:MAG: fasciclin domain-containing protein [Gemmatimonadota bacterium]|jgi:uncharacterized surface protein with fasciclin (FAS1) repeats
MRNGMRVLGAALAVFGLAACAEDTTEPLAIEDAQLVAGAELEDARGRNPATTPTILDVALTVNAETGEFSTLIAAVLEVGLDDALAARGQRTVFAPTDAAFAALGLNAGNIAGVDAETLTDILRFHVAPGRRLAQSVVTASQIRMLNGDFNPIEVTSAGAFIGDAQIIATDFEGSNGVIHVIDDVLIPPTN